jgi:LemA protein
MSKKGFPGGRKVLIVVLVAIVVILAIYIWISYNAMVAKELKVDEAWAQVQNVYERRLDLIPNLAESVKGYMQLEKDIFEAIAQARAGINNAETPSEIESANSEIGSFFRDLRVVVEDTPELKASENVRDLMTQLEGTENRIATERGRFNESVRDYNTYIKMFPRNAVARLFGFEPRDFFEAREGAEIAPEVDLGLQ